MSNNVTKLPSKSYIDFRLLERCSCICDRQTGPGLTSMQEKSHWISYNVAPADKDGQERKGTEGLIWSLAVICILLVSISLPLGSDSAMHDESCDSSNKSKCRRWLDYLIL